MELTHTAARACRLSSLLREEMGLSSGLMNRLKWTGGLLVNGEIVRTNHPVVPGDRITVLLPEETSEYPAEDGPLSVLYEDPWLLAVDKPSGILIHPSRARNTGTLANFVAGYYRHKGESAAFHPLTRLDRDTFGVVLTAKNGYACARVETLQKQYQALVLGGPGEDAGTIDAPIARKPLPSLLREISPQGKPSVTRYQVLFRSEHFALLSLEPVTGRTHQLRLHCAYMGFPILGDPQYGSADSMAVSTALEIGTQCLLAKTIRFIHPMMGDAIAIESRMSLPAPEALEALLKNGGIYPEKIGNNT